MFAIPKAKKLAPILATSILITMSNIKVVFIVPLTTDILAVVSSLKAPVLDNFSLLLEYILYIYYSIRFKKKSNQILDSIRLQQ